MNETTERKLIVFMHVSADRWWRQHEQMDWIRADDEPVESASQQTALAAAALYGSTLLRNNACVLAF